MSQSNQNNSKYFPRLNIDVLKVHAVRWAVQWPDVPIDRIVLYKYASKFQMYYDEPIKSKKKYAIVFEVSYLDIISNIVTPKGHLKHDLKVARGIATQNHYEKFVKDIEYDTSVIQEKKYKALITADFTNVYWNTPEDRFINEWVFIPRPLIYNPEEKKQMPIGLPANVRVAEPHTILFKAEEILQEEMLSVDIQDETIEEDLDDFIAKKEISEKQYIFRSTGPSWHIRYDGNDLFGLKGKGFGYIHFLVKHKRKEYHTDELATEVDKISDPDILDKLKQVVTEKTDNNDYDNKKKKGTDHRDMVYGNSTDKLKKEWNDLERELREAERSNDLPRIEKARKELKEFKKHSYELFRPDGKSRQFIDNTTRNKNRISKSIKRALKNIKNYDESTWQHFKSALNPIHSYYLSYTPDRHINWLTE